MASENGTSFDKNANGASSTLGKCYVIALRVMFSAWLSHFKSHGYIKDSTMHTLDQKTLKRTNEKSVEDPKIREAISTSEKIWDDLAEIFRYAVPSLEQRCYPQETLSDGEPLPAFEGPSSNTIVANHASLLKDIDRVDQMLGIMRNALTFGEKGQNLAAQAAFDREVCDMINLCVKITARGYDGDGSTADEDKWQGVINGFKRLLITCLQFLNNLVTRNERLKLLLWVELFDSSSDPVASIDAIDSNLRNLQATRSPKDWFSSVKNVLETQANVSNEKMGNDKQSFPPKPLKPVTAYFIYLGENGIKIKEELRRSNAETSIDDVMHEALKRWNELPENEKQPWKDEYQKRMDEYKRDLSDWHAATETAKGSNDTLPAETTESNDNEASSSRVSYPPILDDHTQYTLESAADGAKKLAEGKAQLLKRLESVNTDRNYHPEGNTSSVHSSTSSQNHATESALSGGEDVESEEESSDDSDYALPGEDGRGLLTDVPLILGPNEIEVLPMIIATGIVPPEGWPNTSEGTSAHDATDGPDMLTIRCHLLLAQENGRNLLRELLIFVAAWDLRDEELYFKFMVKIIESILMNGLLPFTYNAFKESKDIISPAQAVIMKLLTRIFQSRQAVIDAPLDMIDSKPESSSSESLAPKPFRYDVQVVRSLFSEFRQNIIPQICALIFLQGQIRLGYASIDEFPLNLWDMERMYEGVYQYLEFFAILTDYDSWKVMMAEWEVVSELVTLLQELELAIPKGQPSSQDEVSQLHSPAADTKNNPSIETGFEDQDSHADSTVAVAVERPYDITAPTDTNELEEDKLPPSSPYPEPLHDEPADFEWRNLKKLCVLVLSSLVWKNRRLQDQVRDFGGIPAILSCCAPVDEHNPYIREHAIMCLRFLMEGNDKNQATVKEYAVEAAKSPDTNLRVPEEVLDPRSYETYMDSKGQVGLRKKMMGDAKSESWGAEGVEMVPVWMQSILKTMQEPR